MGAHRGDFWSLYIQDCKNLLNNFGPASLLHKTWRWRIEGTRFCIGVRAIAAPCKLNQEQMVFLICKAPALLRGWNRYSNSSKCIPEGVCSVYCNRKQHVKSNLESGIRVRGQERLWRRKREIHIHVQLAHCLYGREGPFMDIEVKCSTGLAVWIFAVVDGLGWLLWASHILFRKWKALPSDWRGLQGTVRR